MIKQVMPDAYETIYHGALSYSLSPAVFERLMYLALYPDYARLGFNFGIFLPDPDHILIGEGKRLRHVKIRSLDEARQPVIRQLVQAAWDDDKTHIESMKNELLAKRQVSNR